METKTKTVMGYSNDGSGRDTFINHAGAYWMNPLPAGTFFKSAIAEGEVPPGATVLSGYGESTFPGRSLFGQSRYGTTVLVPCADGTFGAVGEDGQPLEGSQGSPAGGTFGRTAADFNPEETAADAIAGDVPCPERRLEQPGHATIGLDGSRGGVSFNGTGDDWKAPKAVDNTLLRLATTYESTCHYGLRTGRFYNEDAAPPHENTLPEKGVNWGKSRYM